MVQREACPAPAAARRSAPAKRCRRSRADRSTSICRSPSASTARPMSGSCASSGSWTNTASTSLCAVISVTSRTVSASAPGLVGDQADQPVMVGEARRAAERLVEQRSGRRRAVRRADSVLANHFGQDMRVRAASRASGRTRPRPRSAKTMAPTRSPSEVDAEGGQRRGLCGGHRLHGAPAAEEHRRCAGRPAAARGRSRSSV